MTGEKTLEEITQKNQKERFSHLSDRERESFFQKLMTHDHLNEDLARAVFELFEDGRAGSVAEAKKIIRESENPSHYSDH